MINSLNSASSASLYRIVGLFSSWCFCSPPSKIERVKSGSYLIDLSVLVLGITTLVGLAGSLGLAFVSKGLVAIFVVSWVEVSTAGFFTGSFAACFAAVFTGCAAFLSG